MIKNTLKIFFKNLIYVFIAMGIIYLFTIIAILMFAVSTVSNIGTMLTDSLALVQSAVADSEVAVQEFLSYSVGQIDTNGNVFDIIYRIIQTDWLKNTLIGFLETLNASTEGFTNDFNVIIGRFTDKLIADCALSLSELAVGIICANYATRFVLSHKSTKWSVKKLLIARIAEPILLSIVVILAVIILTVFRKFAVLVYIAFFAVFAILSLLSSWIVHRDGTVKFKDVVNAKNTIMFLLSVFLVLMITVLFAVILFFVNALVAVLVVIPLLVYSLNIVAVSTNSFVCELIKKSASR